MATNTENIERSALAVLDLYPRLLWSCGARGDSGDDRLTTYQLQVLDALDRERPWSLSELASTLGVTNSTMSLTVRRLVERGLVVRDRDPADRRRLLICLSDAGYDALDEQEMLDFDKVCTVLDELSPAHRRQVVRALTLLARATEKAASE